MKALSAKLNNQLLYYYCTSQGYILKYYLENIDSVITIFVHTNITVILDKFPR